MQDVDHYIEWYKPPAHCRCKVYDLRQKLRDKRRELKNERKITGAILTCVKHKSDLQNMVKAIKDVEKQSYTPRVLDGLFEGNFDMEEYKYLWEDN